MNFKRHVVLGLALLMTLSHLACGGGGGGGGGGSTPVTRTGVFKDSNVEGIRYETSSGLSGVTDATGQYVYDTNDTVTFYVGMVELGTTDARGVVMPIDLVNGGSSASIPVLNIVRFLMMLDADGNPDNVILISTDVRTAADSWSQLDFGAPDFDTTVGPIMTECTDADGGDHDLPAMGTARDHIEASMRCAYSGAFKGTFNGSDNGRFGVVIDARTGLVHGAAYSNTYQDMTEARGDENISYDQDRAFITGFVDTGAAFNGQLTTPDAMSGDWEDTYGSDHGAFSGRRLGGAFDATRRFTGIASDDYGTAAVMTMDVDDAGAITGLAFDIENNRNFTFSGTLSGAAITATTSDGVLITGTLAPNDTFTGRWRSPDGDSGDFSGSGCRLN